MGVATCLGKAYCASPVKECDVEYHSDEEKREDVLNHVQEARGQVPAYRQFYHREQDVPAIKDWYRQQIHYAKGESHQDYEGKPAAKEVEPVA